jgi:hypothetical protein
MIGFADKADQADALTHAGPDSRTTRSARSHGTPRTIPASIAELSRTRSRRRRKRRRGRHSARPLPRRGPADARWPHADSTTDQPGPFGRARWRRPRPGCRVGGQQRPRPPPRLRQMPHRLRANRPPPHRSRRERPRYQSAASVITLKGYITCYEQLVGTHQAPLQAGSRRATGPGLG